MIDHFGLWFDQPIVTIDFETTGYSPSYGDRVVEVAAVRIEKLKVVKKWHSFINPERPIPEEASRIHLIYDEDVGLAPTMRQKGPELLAFCDGAVPCAYSERFDRGFAMAELWRMGPGLDIPLLQWDPWLDPLAWVRSIGRFGDEKNDLASACARYGVKLENAHGALADAVATAELLIAIAPDMHRSTISELLRRQTLLATTYDKRKKKRMP